MTDSTGELTPLDLVAEGPAPGGDGDDFARQIGRDARRVARGDLSEEAFYEYYHEALVARFGVDRRPGGGRE